MIADLGMVLAGLVLLVLAGDGLVRGAVNLALRLGIPPIIVGLTVVAFGTSAPELLVSVQAVLRGAPDIALGNVVGSNIANILLVLGIPALISAIHLSDAKCEHGFVVMMAATAGFIALAFAGPFTWWHGLLLLAGLAYMLGDNFNRARAHRNGMRAEALDAEALEGADPHMAWWKVLALLAVGLVGLPIGADLLVDGAVGIARAVGMSEAVIGLTLVAVGTSLPELAATTAAAFRREADMAVGNVIGSNIFNLLGIIGIAALVGPLPVPSQMLGFDLWVMAATSAMLAPFIYWRWVMGRAMGLVLIAVYVAYVVMLVV